MDNAKVFDTLEKKIEKMLGKLRSLEQDNEKLEVDLATARRAEKDAADHRGVIERLEKEQETVRQRLQKLIESLEAAEKA